MGHLWRPSAIYTISLRHRDLGAVLDSAGIYFKSLLNCGCRCATLRAQRIGDLAVTVCTHVGRADCSLHTLAWCARPLGYPATDTQRTTAMCHDVGPLTSECLDFQVCVSSIIGNNEVRETEAYFKVKVER